MEMAASCSSLDDGKNNAIPLTLHWRHQSGAIMLSTSRSEKVARTPQATHYNFVRLNLKQSVHLQQKATEYQLETQATTKHQPKSFVT